ncbi:MAG: hypothetical protein UY54_C0026G0006 [Parcubacteria group bacterium GW2011_GWA2_50_10b]|nr:MAG: hypothetical protein UY54_C0026G0006 [Parcubacteria group bacterium GW2011_GWA2_50_10b]
MNRGSTLIETVIYIFIFALLSGVMASALFSITRSYAIIESSVTLETTAETALERIVRETRNSLSIDAVESVLGSSPGTLVLNTTDENGAAATLAFSLSGEAVRVKENGIDIGPLSSGKARVTRLLFTPVNTVNSSAVRIEMVVESGQDANYKSKIFHTSAVLRGSYAP